MCVPVSAASQAVIRDVFLVAAVFSAPFHCQPPEAAANGAIMDGRQGPIILVSWSELLSPLLSELGQRS